VVFLLEDGDFYWVFATMVAAMVSDWRRLIRDA